MKRKLILPLVLTVVLALTAILAIGASANENTEPTLNLTGANLVFSDRVHILYAVDSEGVTNPEEIELLIFRGENINISNCLKGNEAATVKTNGKTVSSGTVKGFQYEYADIAAAEMTEDIYARAYYTDGECTYYSSVVKYSVLQYACNKLGVTGTRTSKTELINMLEGMLEYGAFAQEYFDKNLDRLATDEYVRYEFEDGILSDGLNYGLYKKGELFTVTATVSEADKPYIVWKGDDGQTIGVGETCELTAKKNRSVTAVPQSTSPSFGSYKYVVIIGVDGAGSYYLDKTDTPNIDAIFAEGAVSTDMRVTSPSSSSVSWMSCLHGVKPENHGNTENAEVEAGIPYTMNSK